MNSHHEILPELFPCDTLLSDGSIISTSSAEYFRSWLAFLFATRSSRVGAL